MKGQYLLLRALPSPIRRVLYGEDVYLLPRPDGTIYCRHADRGLYRWINGASTTLASDVQTFLVSASNAVAAALQWQSIASRAST